MEMESSKYTPNNEVKHIQEDGRDKIQFIFQVSEESSGRDIDIDVSSTQIKLNSKK